MGTYPAASALAGPAGVGRAAVEIADADSVWPALDDVEGYESGDA